MRVLVYLLSLVVAVGGAAYFADQGRPVLTVLAVVPGYFVVAYVLVLVLSFLPGAERRRFEAARAATLPGTSPLPPDTVMHPAYLGSLFETMYSGDGFLGWPEGGDLVFRATALQPQTFAFPARAFKGYRVEAEPPAFLADDSFIVRGRGPVVVLDAGPAAAMARVWVQPGDAASFADRLRALGVPDLTAGAQGQDESHA